MYSHEDSLSPEARIYAMRNVKKPFHNNLSDIFFHTWSVTPYLFDHIRRLWIDSSIRLGVHLLIHCTLMIDDQFRIGGISSIRRLSIWYCILDILQYPGLVRYISRERLILRKRGNWPFDHVYFWLVLFKL